MRFLLAVIAVIPTSRDTAFQKFGFYKIYEMWASYSSIAMNFTGLILRHCKSMSMLTPCIKFHPIRMGRMSKSANVRVGWSWNAPIVMRRRESFL